MDEHNKKSIKAIIIGIILLGIIILTSSCQQQYIIEPKSTITQVIPEATITLNSAEGLLTVTMIDVGTGQAIAIQKDNKIMLVDTGKNKELLYGFLNANNISSIDTIMITNQDEDHAGLLSPLLKDYSVSTVITNGQEVDKVFWNDYKKTMSEQGKTQYILRENQVLSWQNMSMRILNPPEPLQSKETNRNSIVMNVEYADTGILLMGDCEESCEKHITETKSINPVDLLIVGHHGSKTSSSKELLDWAIKPPKKAECFISNGNKNPYGHPDSVVVDRLKEYCDHIITTGNQGSTTFRTDGYKYLVITKKNL